MRNARSRRTASRQMRTTVGLGLLVGLAGWVFLAHEIAERLGRDDLLRGTRPAYLAVAAATYWPVAMILWWLAFPGDRRALPWAPEDPPVRFMSEAEAKALADRIESESALAARVNCRGGRFAVDLATPATTYRLYLASEWEALRPRLGRTTTEPGEG